MTQPWFCRTLPGYPKGSLPAPPSPPSLRWSDVLLMLGALTSENRSSSCGKKPCHISAVPGMHVRLAIGVAQLQLLQIGGFIAATKHCQSGRPWSPQSRSKGRCFPYGSQTLQKWIYKHLVMGFILRADIPGRKLSAVEVFTGIETYGKHFSDCHYSGGLNVQNSPESYLLNNSHCCWGWTPFELFMFCKKGTSVKWTVLAWWRRGMNTKALILWMFAFPCNFQERN